MTPAFLTKLRFEDDGGFPLTLIGPLVYDSALVNEPITAPEGFKTDLASIPRVLWNVLPPVGKYDAAAVVHDFLYQTAPFGIDRKRADDVLLEAMRVCGVSKVTRSVIYAGVRCGGMFVWKRYRHEASAPA